jgi:hypothetical protein
MIVSNRTHLFGFSHFGVAQTDKFACAVITAPEGWFKPSSSVFLQFEDNWETDPNRRIAAKAYLYDRLTRSQRRAVHKAFLDHLDHWGSSGAALDDAIRQAAAQEAASVSRLAALWL